MEFVVQTFGVVVQLILQALWCITDRHFFLQHLELGVPLGGGGLAVQEEYCYNHETFVLHETLVLHCVRGTVEWSMCVLFRYANARNHETVVVHCMHTVQLINELVFWIIPQYLYLLSS